MQKTKNKNQHLITSKQITIKLLEVINEFGKVARYKINAQKSLAFLYINDEKSEREIKDRKSTRLNSSHT